MKYMFVYFCWVFRKNHSPSLLRSSITPERVKWERMLLAQTMPVFEIFIKLLKTKRVQPLNWTTGTKKENRFLILYKTISFSYDVKNYFLIYSHSLCK